MTIKIPGKNATLLDHAVFELQTEIDKAVHDAARDRDPYKASFGKDDPLQKAINSVVSASQSRTYASAYRLGWNNAIEMMQVEMGQRKKP